MDTDTDSIFGNIVPFPGDDILLGNDADVDMFLSSSSIVSLPKDSTTNTVNLSSSTPFLASSSSSSSSSSKTPLVHATHPFHASNGGTVSSSSHASNLPFQLRCEICTGAVWNNLDPILTCITCGIKVHRGCYGSGGRIRTSMNGNTHPNSSNGSSNNIFQCQLCLGDTIQYQQQYACSAVSDTILSSSSSSSSSSFPLPVVRTCVICSNTGGAMKPVVEGGYAHIACATWLPELVVDNLINMLSNIGNIAKDRATLQCSVCHKTGGCFQCGHGKCSESYHGHCVLEAVLSGIAYAAPIPLHGGWQWKVYCSKHSKEARNNYAIVINQYLRGVDQARTKVNNRSLSVNLKPTNGNNGESSLQITSNREQDDENDSDNDDDDDDDDNESKADTATDAVGKKVTKPRSTKLFVRSYFPRSFHNLPVRGPTTRNGAWNDTTGSVETTLTISEDDKITDPAAQYELQEKFWSLVVDPYFVPLEIHDINCLAFLIDRAGNPTSHTSTAVTTNTSTILSSTSSSTKASTAGNGKTHDPNDSLPRTTLSSAPFSTTPLQPSVVDIDVSVNAPPNIQRSGASLVRDSSLVYSNDNDASKVVDTVNVSVGIHHGSFRAAMDFGVSLKDPTVLPSNFTADDIDVQLNDWNALNWQDDTAVIMAKTLNIAYGKLGRPTLMAKTMATDEDPIHEILGSRIEFLDIYDDISTNIAALQAALREEQRATAVRTLQLASRVQASGYAQELMQKVGLVLDDSLMELMIGRRTIQNTSSAYLPFPISPPNGVECLPWQHAIPPSVGRRLYRLPETTVPPIPASTVARQPPRSNIPEIIFTKLFEAACDAATWKVVTRHLERGIRDHSEEDLIRSKRAIPASWLIKAEGRPTMEQLQKDGVDHSPGICSVCWDLHSSPEDDTTLSCERCHMYFHRRCYGIVNDPALTEDEVPFLCDPCAVAEQNVVRNIEMIGKVSKKPKLVNKPTAPVETCYLCNLSGGAFKRSIQGPWVHIFCALWSPYAKIVNVQKMGPIDLYSQELLALDESPHNSSSIMINPIAESLSNYRRLIDAASGSLVDGGYDKFVASLTNTFDTVTLAQNRQKVFKTLTRELSVIHLANPVIYNAQKEGLLVPSTDSIPKRTQLDKPTIADTPLDFSHIFSKPQSTACHLCGDKNGLLIHCSIQTCDHAMHPMCAWREGLQLSITIPGSKMDTELLTKLHTVANSLNKECLVPVSTTLSSTSNLLLVPVCSFIYCGGRKGLRYVSFCKSHGVDNHNCENQKQLRKSMFSETLANPLDDETFFEWRNARGVGRRIILNRGRRKSRDENEDEEEERDNEAQNTNKNNGTIESKSVTKYPSTSQKDTSTNRSNASKPVKNLTLTLPAPVVVPPPPKIVEPVLPIRIKVFPDGTAHIKERYEAMLEYNKNKK